jgi:hypothetical protein
VKQARGASPAERREAHRPKPKEINTMPLDNKQIPSDAMIERTFVLLRTINASVSRDTAYNFCRQILEAARPQTTEQQDSDGLVERAARAMFEHEWEGNPPQGDWEISREYWIGHAKVALGKA